MAITNYTELKASIASWLNRSDLTTVIPDLITLAEAQFRREIRFWGMIAQDVVSAGVDELYEALPGDWLELRAIWFETTPIVRPEYLTPAALETWRSNNQGAQGTPEHYTLVGNRIKFDRIPTGHPVLYLESYVALPALSGSNASNVLLDTNPDIYLWGALMMAEPYLKNDPRLATWTALYQSARDALHKADKRSQASPSPLLMRPARPAF